MENEGKSREIDILEYWRVIYKRRWIALIFLGMLLSLTALFSFLMTPLYKATTTLLIEEESPRTLSLEATFGNQAQVIPDLRSYNTQIKLLKSTSLSERVARKLNLLSRPEFGLKDGSRMGLFAGIKYLVTFRWLSSSKKSDASPGPSIPTSPYLGLAAALLPMIDVKPVRETKLVEVAFISPSPTFATEFVNALAVEYIDFSIEKRFATTQQASNWLTEQVDILKTDLAATERELLRYGQEKDIVFLSETESAAVNTFADLNEAFNKAMLERIDAEAEFRELKNFEGDSATRPSSDPAIQQLKSEYARLHTDYQEKSKQLKADHPEMLRMKARLDSLKEEINKAADAAESKYQSALKKEGSFRATLDRQRNDVQKMKNNAIMYNSIKSEVESKRRLLNTLMEKQSETQISAQLRGLNASNISIIDPAEVPKFPISPNKTKNLFIALFMGIFGGAGLCFLLDYLDDSIKGPDDAERLTDVPSLGMIPYLPPEGISKSKGYGYYLKHHYSSQKQASETEPSLPEIKEIELVNHFHADFALAEDYRTVRTSILLSHAEKPPKSIVFTSALSQEGKTATVVNMGISFAQLQERVLIVEADLRKPRLHRIFRTKNMHGLTSYLTGKESLKEVIQKSFVENIWLIPSGPIPPNPAELLNSKKMKDLLEEVIQVFDLVLLDSPPVLAVSDPVIVASISECAVMVVRAGKTRRKAFLNAVNELKRARANIIGLIFNAAALRKEGAYYSRYHRNYEYGQYGADDQNMPLGNP